MQGQALIYHRYGSPSESLTLYSQQYLPPLMNHVRVQMHYSPVNPSDLIPISGAYRHRISLPTIAGYEGMGKVVIPAGSLQAGQRVLPLRGEGTWQSLVDAPSQWVIPVPDDIDDSTAARAYINPLAALLMIQRWSPVGKNILVTGGGSSCSQLLIRWSAACGARHISAVYRSPSHRAGLIQAGVEAISCYHTDKIRQRLQTTDIIFDSVGGELARLMLSHASPEAAFISYGLLSGVPFYPVPEGPVVQRFHIRDALQRMTAEEWHLQFRRIWEYLRVTPQSPVREYRLAQWQEALDWYLHTGREAKPVLSFR